MVAPGGGMPCAYYAGVDRGIEEQFGFSKLERVITTSGQAANLAYRVSGQSHWIGPIWEALVKSKQFVRSLALIGRRGMFDIDFLIDKMIKEYFPHDRDAFMQNPIRFDVGVTNAATGKGRFFPKEEVPNFYELLRASCAVPYFYGKAVQLMGEHWYDGTIGSPTGIEQAENDSNILVILTRPARPIKKLRLARWLLRKLLLRRETLELAEAVCSMPARYNRDLRQIEELKAKKNIVVIRPKTRLPMFRIDTSLERLRATIEQGYRDTIENPELKRFFSNL
jgi:predicted patatin/cPLA2 family phospholipase